MIKPYYSDNYVKIYHGDCREILPELPDNSVDLVLTSPPYNRERNDTYKFYDDRVVDYYDLLSITCAEAMRISRLWSFINLQKNYYNKSDIFHLFGSLSNSIIELFAWGKANPTPASGHSITNSFEMFLVLGETPLISNLTYTKNLLITSVNSDMPEEHSAVMKTEVADWFITRFTKPSDIILDYFLGLGTTAYCAKKLNRHCIGIEIEKKYCEIAANRCRQMVMELNA